MDDVEPPPFSYARVKCFLSAFRPLTENVMISHIKLLSNKFLEADFLRTHLLKKCADIFASFLTSLFNRSLSENIFPLVGKECVTPVLKKILS